MSNFWDEYDRRLAKALKNPNLRRINDAAARHEAELKISHPEGSVVSWEMHRASGTYLRRGTVVGYQWSGFGRPIRLRLVVSHGRTRSTPHPEDVELEEVPQ